MWPLTNSTNEKIAANISIELKFLSKFKNELIKYVKSKSKMVTKVHKKTTYWTKLGGKKAPGDFQELKI